LIIPFSEIIGSLESLRTRLGFWRAKREEFTQHGSDHTKCVSVFHILDSLQDDIVAIGAGNKLQNILLKHFEDQAFLEGRITINMAQAIFFLQYLTFFNQMMQVPLQTNSNDCACFTIYFGKKFFLDPDSTLDLLKVISINW
jgi:hypothetical protein